ncbi:MAG TPA: hypothetical protein VJ201_05805 [Candidatus Babeliales bacterium]|nr:hypothetical protein [Candidatus Babeliales bacterium]
MQLTLSVSQHDEQQFEDEVPQQPLEQFVPHESVEVKHDLSQHFEHVPHFPSEQQLLDEEHLLQEPHFPSEQPDTPVLQPLVPQLFEDESAIVNDETTNNALSAVNLKRCFISYSFLEWLIFTITSSIH